MHRYRIQLAAAAALVALTALPAPGALAFMAQDDAGNVWSLGEYPEEIDATTGARSAPRTWLAGHQGATAGVLMRANPQTNTSAYLQGLAPAVQFIDEARVAQTNQT